MKVPPFLIVMVGGLAIVLVFGGPDGVWMILVVGVVGLAITYLPYLLFLAAMKFESLWMFRAARGLLWFCTGKRFDMEKFLREDGLKDER